MVSPWQIEVSVALSETAGELVARPNAGSVKLFQPVNVRELRVGDGCGLVTTTPAFSHLGWFCQCAISVKLLCSMSSKKRDMSTGSAPLVWYMRW